MRTMKIGNSGIEASVVGMGAWAIGGDSMWGASDDAESVRTIHRARALGVTLLDTAPAYGLGHSEEVVGKALVGRRGDYVLSTKCGIRWDIKEGALLMERDGRAHRAQYPAGATGGRARNESAPPQDRLHRHLYRALAGAAGIPLPDRGHHGFSDGDEEAGQDPRDRGVQPQSRAVRRIHAGPGNWI